MTLSDKINRMIEFALFGAQVTSASPEKVNEVYFVGELDEADLELDIREIVKEELKQTKTETTSKDSVKPIVDKTKAISPTDKKIDKVEDTLTNLDNSLGDLASLSKTQIGNLTSFSSDPFKFMISRVFKKLSKGAGVILLVTIISLAVQFIIAELMKPGRLLDRRFKRIARDEILLFNSTEEQAELRQGFRTVIITTIPFLRGAELRGQISGNLYNPTAIPQNRLDERRVIPPMVITYNGSRATQFANRRNR